MAGDDEHLRDANCSEPMLRQNLPNKPAQHCGRDEEIGRVLAYPCSAATVSKRTAGEALGLRACLPSGHSPGRTDRSCTMSCAVTLQECSVRTARRLLSRGTGGTTSRHSCSIMPAHSTGGMIFFKPLDSAGWAEWGLPRSQSCSRYLLYGPAKGGKVSR